MSSATEMPMSLSRVTTRIRYGKVVARRSELLRECFARDTWNDAIHESLRNMTDVMSKKHYSLLDISFEKYEDLGMDPVANSFAATTDCDSLINGYQHLCSMKLSHRAVSCCFGNKGQAKPGFKMVFEDQLAPRLAVCIFAAIPLVCDCGSRELLEVLFTKLPTASLTSEAPKLSPSFLLAFLTGNQFFHRQRFAATSLPDHCQRLLILKRLLQSTVKITLDMVNEVHASVMGAYKALIDGPVLHEINKKYVVPVLSEMLSKGPLDVLVDRIKEGAADNEEADAYMWAGSDDLLLPSTGDGEDESTEFRWNEYLLSSLMTGQSHHAFVAAACERAFSEKFSEDLYRDYQKMPYIRCQGYRRGSLINVTTPWCDNPEQVFFPIGAIGDCPMWYGGTHPSPMQQKLFEAVRLLEEVIIDAQLYGVSQQPDLKRKFIPRWMTNIAVTTVNPPSFSYGPHSDACPTNTCADEEDCIETGLPPASHLRTITCVMTAREFRDKDDAMHRLSFSPAEPNLNSIDIAGTGSKPLVVGNGFHLQMEGSQHSVHHEPIAEHTGLCTRYVTTMRRIALPIGAQQASRFFPNVTFQSRVQKAAEKTSASATFLNEYVTFKFGAERAVRSERLDEEYARPFSSYGHLLEAPDSVPERADRDNSAVLEHAYKRFQAHRDLFDHYSLENDDEHPLFAHFLAKAPVRCRSRESAAEILAHHTVVKALFDMTEGYVFEVFHPKTNPGGDPVSLLPLTSEGSMYRQGELYKESPIYRRFGVKVNPASHSHPFAQNKRGHFMAAMVFSRKYKTQLDSLLELWEWALRKGYDHGEVSYGPVYQGKIHSYLSGGSGQKGDTTTPSLSSHGAVYEVVNGQKIGTNGTTNNNVLEHARMGLVHAVFVNAAKLCDELTDDEVQHYPLVSTLRHCYLSDKRDGKVFEEELMFLNYAYVEAVEAIDGSEEGVVSERGMEYSFLYGLHYRFTLNPFGSPDELRKWGEREQTFPASVIKLNGDECGPVVVGMTPEQIERFKQGKAPMTARDLRQHLIRGGFRRFMGTAETEADMVGADNQPIAIRHSSQTIVTFARELIALMCFTNASAALRFKGRGMSGRGACPLGDENLGSVLRRFPLPQAQRELDTVPCAVMAMGLDLGVCAATNESFGRIRRLKVNCHDDLSSPSAMTALANILLFRISGNPKLLTVFKDVSEMLRKENTEPTICATGKKFDEWFAAESRPISSFGLSGISEGDLKLWMAFTMAVEGCSPSTAVRTKIKHLITGQHRNAIMSGLVRSVHNYSTFVFEALTQFPVEVRNGWVNAKERDAGQMAALLDHITGFLSTFCHKLGKPQDDKARFIAQHLLLDMLLLFDFGFKVDVDDSRSTRDNDSTRKRKRKSKKQRRMEMDIQRRKRLNYAEFPPDQVHLHSGSLRAFTHIRKKFPENIESFGDLFSTVLEALDDVSDVILGCLALRREKRRSGEYVYYNDVSGTVWNAIHFEHWPCKLTLVVTRAEPSTYSEQPKADRGCTHPVTTGKRGGEIRYTWEEYPPVVDAMDDILLAYKEGLADGSLILPLRMAEYRN